MTILHFSYGREKNRHIYLLIFSALDKITSLDVYLYHVKHELLKWQITGENLII